MLVLQSRMHSIFVRSNVIRPYEINNNRTTQVYTHTHTHTPIDFSLFQIKIYDYFAKISFANFNGKMKTNKMFPLIKYKDKIFQALNHTLTNNVNYDF